MYIININLLHFSGGAIALQPFFISSASQNVFPVKFALGHPVWGSFISMCYNIYGEREDVIIFDLSNER